MNIGIDGPCRICGHSYLRHTRQGCADCTYCGGFDPQDSGREQSSAALERIAAALEEQAIGTWRLVLLQSSNMVREDGDTMTSNDAAWTALRRLTKAQQARNASGGDADGR